ncbi:glycosyltransferase [Paenibacillus tarimensis]
MLGRQSESNKILILSGALGDGHMQAAKAIVEASAIYKPGTAVKVVDVMEWIHPRLHVIERYCFVQWVRHFPSLYGYLYQKTREDNPLTYFLKKFSTSSLHRLHRLVGDEQPTVLVSTFPPASAAISLLKEKGMTDLPFVTVITDYSDHCYWIHPYTDLYLVGSEEVGSALRIKDVPDNKIAVTGIPIRPSYTRYCNKDRLREMFGIPLSSFVVLVMGGGWGMIDKTFVEQLQSKPFPPGVQFVIVCGRNEKLLNRLSEALQGRRNVMLKGFVENMHEWMAAADVLVTKPGGLTTSEALALELPMLLFEPTLGQERDNANYLTRRGAAIPCQTGNLHSQLLQMVRDPGLLREMGERAGRCGQQESAMHAVKRIMSVTSHTGETAAHSTVQQYA